MHIGDQVNLWRVCAASVVFGLALSCPAGADGPAASPREPVKADQASKPQESPQWASLNVAHIRVVGDLDSARLLAAFEEACRGARNAGSDVVVVECAGRKWRSDVLLGMAKAMKPDGWNGKVLMLVPASGDGAASMAMVSLGLCVDACFVASRAKITHGESDELATLLPEDFDKDSCERDLRGLAWTAMQSRGGEALLTSIVPRPSCALYLGAGTDGRPRALPEPAPDGAKEPLIRPVSGGEQLAIDAQTAERIGLITGQARSPSEVLSRSMIRAKKSHRFEVVSELARAKERMERELKVVDEAKRKAKGAIDSVYSLRALDAVPRQRRVGVEQKPLLESAARQLESIEKLAIEYPELLKTVPPGTTEIGQDARSISHAWKNYFQSRRTELESLLAKALSLSEK